MKLKYHTSGTCCLKLKLKIKISSNKIVAQCLMERSRVFICRFRCLDRRRHGCWHPSSMIDRIAFCLAGPPSLSLSRNVQLQQSPHHQCLLGQDTAGWLRGDGGQIHSFLPRPKVSRAAEQPKCHCWLKNSYPASQRQRGGRDWSVTALEEFYS